MTKETNTIIWDWNGTLLNDVEQSIATMNELLTKRKLPLLSHQYYKEIFDFPVYNYYEILGFDFKKEKWSDVAAEYMRAYHNKEASFELFDEAISTLNTLKKQSYRHYILSAMRTDSINKMLDSFQIRQLFDGVYGLDDDFANGKVETGHQLLSDITTAPEQCVLVGDTTHDAVVAKSLGIKCILIANGHHSYQRLKASKSLILQSLSELSKLID